MDPLLSEPVGDFVIQERIGSGGMGVVYRATHRLIGKQAAIKVLRAELVSQQQVERLLIEARAVNAIRHPGIIDIFGFGDLPDGRPYIIMELLQGQSLSELIRQQRRIDVNATVWILDQMLAALGAAHRAGVVHRDLKPGNVFMAEGLDGTRSVKLVDFGIAKLVMSHDGPTTVDGSILGTPEFMAPEQIRGASVSPSTDLYAVGIIAFQMLTGSRPFNGEPFQVMFAHVEQLPPLPSSRAPGIPPELDTLVLQLLAKQPELRPESAEAVRQALKRIPLMGLASAPSSRPSPAPASVREEQTRTTTLPGLTPRPSVAKRAPRWIAGAALIAGVTGGAFLFWPSQPHSPPATTPVTEKAPTAANSIAESPKAEPPAPTEASSGEGIVPATAAQEPALPETAPAPSKETLAAEQPVPTAMPIRPAPSKLRGKEKTPGTPSGHLPEQSQGVSITEIGTLLEKRREAQPTPSPRDSSQPPTSPIPGKQGSPELQQAPAPQLEAPPPKAQPVPPERRTPILPRTGPQPADPNIAARLRNAEALYLERPAGSPRRRKVERELLRLHGLAVEADTADKRSKVLVELYKLEQRIKSPASSYIDENSENDTEIPDEPESVSPQPLKTDERTENEAETPDESISFSTQIDDRVKKLMDDLREEINEAERQYRAEAGASTPAPDPLEELSRLRQRAQKTPRAAARETLKKDILNWKKKFLNRNK
ncbi:serine/threonine-protein kinase [Pyxidicoccus xibeiensis]|uniref:serine/threonine-protein kinase n=1 Tax=Pyxidicoccus xibeiensis TaxID=2906759 RepID=UPI0020A7511F|nr:serine/threonine protein kinase [Pyxidicoccus xibeiensis]MCP3137176.1 protein kinase [Pyxidicoccus xibeiensis]